MDFPADWVVRPMEEYTTAGPNYQGEFTVDLLAQLRSTGRILDGFPFALDSSAPLEAVVVLDNILPADYYRDWKAYPAVLGVGRRHQVEHRLLSLDQPDRFRGQSGMWHHRRKGRGGPGRPLHPEHHGPPQGRTDQRLNSIVGHHRRRRLP
jgi:hypothetical protein